MIEDRGTPKILIVGGGLAGLFCALECVRNGFNTTVLESRDAIQTAGKIASQPSTIYTLLIRLLNNR